MKKNKGVSIITLVITIIIIIIIAGVTMLRSTKSLEEANKVKFQNDLKSFVELIDAYNVRAEIRGIATYDSDELTWDGTSEKAENTARIKNKAEEDSIRDILDGNQIPETLKGIVSIENGKVKISEDAGQKYEWAVEKYSEIGE